MTKVNNAATTIETNEETTLVPVREACAAEIKVLLESVGTTYLKIGGLLNEARPDFENQAEFLEWVSSEFGIKKAQTFKLMKVARVFAEDTRFDGVAMRVLLILSDFIELDEIVEKAAELAANGALDTQSINALIAPAKPNKAASGQEVKPDVTPETPDVAEGEMPWEADENTDAPQPRNVGLNPALAASYGSGEDAPATIPSPAKDADSERVSGLLSLIETLKATNQAMADELAAIRSERTAKKASAPMLPHFKHKSFPVRLGLTEEEATKKTNVNKAKRELLKAGYGEGHEAWAFISEAVEALTKA